MLTCRCPKSFVFLLLKQKQLVKNIKLNIFDWRRKSHKKFIFCLVELKTICKNFKIFSIWFYDKKRNIHFRNKHARNDHKNQQHKSILNLKLNRKKHLFNAIDLIKEKTICQNTLKAWEKYLHFLFFPSHSC